MIDFKKLYPSVYYDKSRDFQLIGRTYEIVFNYLKTGVDTIKHDPLTTDSDEQLLDLMSYTLGFKPKHKYNTTQLVAICSVLMLIMKNKGSTKSIEYALAALLKAEGITDEGTISVDYNILTIHCPSQLSDIVLLNDLLDYILPAGLSYNIIRQSQTTTAYEEYPVTSSDYTISAVQMNTDVSIAPTYEITSTMVPADIGEGRIDNSSVVTYALVPTWKVLSSSEIETGTPLFGNSNSTLFYNTANESVRQAAYNTSKYVVKDDAGTTTLLSLLDNTTEIKGTVYTKSLLLTDNGTYSTISGDAITSSNNVITITYNDNTIVNKGTYDIIYY